MGTSAVATLDLIDQGYDIQVGADAEGSPRNRVNRFYFLVFFTNKLTHLVLNKQLPQKFNNNNSKKIIY